MDSNDTQTISEGQVATDSPSAEGTTVATPNDGDGQVVGDNGTSAQHSDKSTGEVFFDHRTWEETISTLPQDAQKQARAAYKQMQSAFTKRMQGLSKDADKVAAYKAFESNPMEYIKKYLAPYGYNLVQGNGQNQPQNQSRTDWDANPPQTWGEVKEKIVSEAVEQAMSRFQGNLQPIMSGIQNLTTQNIEEKLDSIDPNWRVYEDAMKETLSKHPTMVQDIATLYEMSVPKSIRESKAVQTAIKKMQNKANNAQTEVKSTSVKTKPAAREIGGFDDAVNAAKDTLRAQGLY